MKTDLYKGVPRKWQNNRVHHGLVCGKSIKPRNLGITVTVYEVRENGKTIYRATSGTGVPTKAITLAKEVAERNGLA